MLNVHIFPTMYQGNTIPHLFSCCVICYARLISWRVSYSVIFVNVHAHTPAGPSGHPSGQRGAEGFPAPPRRACRKWTLWKQDHTRPTHTVPKTSVGAPDISVRTPTGSLGQCPEHTEPKWRPCDCSRDRKRSLSVGHTSGSRRGWPGGPAGEPSVCLCPIF